jgi:hypothetical protein
MQRRLLSCESSNSISWYFRLWSERFALAFGDFLARVEGSDNFIDFTSLRNPKRYNWSHFARLFDPKFSGLFGEKFQSSTNCK